ncbi:FAD synthetase family protein [Lacticaseibacillus kribbianus]|uniref:FAD synthetase family protein n=1 Tax=Lacticaseibacillus kribbianus TaxID=2926292 RepID=UPI001CD6B07C|nr:FAD synthetase family protein [Lacticaseibacillus kribbianus]
MDVTMLNLTASPVPLHAPCVLALGFFDGVHRGHQRVIAAARTAARDAGVALSVLTFDRHASALFAKRPVPYLTTIAQKAELMAELGVDHLYVATFDSAFANLSPEAFVADCLVPLGAVRVVAGFDYTFGRGGTTTAAALPALAAGRFATTVVPKLTAARQKVSSTRIRGLIAAGNFAAATALLGHPYVIADPTSQQLPPNGCYEAVDQGGRPVRVRVADNILRLPAGCTQLRFLRRQPQIQAVGG